MGQNHVLFSNNLNKGHAYSTNLEKAYKYYVVWIWPSMPVFGDSCANFPTNSRARRECFLIKGKIYSRVRIAADATLIKSFVQILIRLAL